MVEAKLSCVDIDQVGRGEHIHQRKNHNGRTGQIFRTDAERRGSFVCSTCRLHLLKKKASVPQIAK